MTADAETWWGKLLGFVMALIVGTFLFVFTIRFYVAWMRHKAGFD